jgi:tRNA nucleotidyltransferase (CCA-adding enzyme)
VPIGVEHGTVGVLTRDGTLLEVTTFRKDVETFGRRAVVEFADTLEEDLSRRDFTINSIAWHPGREEFRDPFGGRADLGARILRTVGKPHDRFAEDLLRVLRGLRFSGRFRMEIEPGTWRALCAATADLGVLSPERVREELNKVLSETLLPSGTLALYQAAGAIGSLYPELAGLAGRSRGQTGEDLLTHAFLLTDALPIRMPRLRLAALFHGLAGSEERSSVAGLMFRLRFSRAEIDEVTGLIHAGLDPPPEMEDGQALRRWLHRATPPRAPAVFRVWLAKARLDAVRGERGPEPVLSLIRRLRDEMRRRPPLTLDELAFSGRDLIGMGLKPGPYFGEILSLLLDRVLEEPKMNEEARLRELVEESLERGRFTVS